MDPPKSSSETILLNSAAARFSDFQYRIDITEIITMPISLLLNSTFSRHVRQAKLQLFVSVYSHRLSELMFDPAFRI
jgi:hypothetical protein